MGVKTVFTGTDTELECYLEAGELNIWVGDSGVAQPMGGLITLDKEHTSKLIKILQELESQMPD